MRTVVSVSMDPEMASRLKASSAELGQSFSAHVCDLITVGEHGSRGLFDNTVEETEPEPLRANFGSVEHLVMSEEDIELHDDDASASGLGDTPAEVVDKGFVPELGPAQPTRRELSPKGTTAERVYACVLPEKRSIKDVAEAAGVSVEEATEILDYLIDVDGEPIQVKLVAGEWFCWLDA